MKEKIFECGLIIYGILLGLWYLYNYEDFYNIPA